MKRRFFAVMLAVSLVFSSFAGLNLSALANAVSIEKGFVYYLPDEPVTLSPFTIQPENGTDIFFDGLDLESQIYFKWDISEDGGASWQALRTESFEVLIPAVTPKMARTLFRLHIADDAGHFNDIEIHFRNFREDIDKEILQPDTQHTLCATAEEADRGEFNRIFKIEAGTCDFMRLRYENITVNMTCCLYDRCLNEIQRMKIMKDASGMLFQNLPDGGSYYLSFSSEEDVICKEGDVLGRFKFSYDMNTIDPSYTITERAVFDESMDILGKITDQYIFVPVELDFYDILYFDTFAQDIKIADAFQLQQPILQIGENAFIAMSKGTYYIPLDLRRSSRSFTVMFHKLSPDFSKAGTILPGDESTSVSDLTKNAAFIYNETAWSNVFGKYSYSYGYYRQQFEDLTYDDYILLRNELEKTCRNLAKACKINVPAGNVFYYSEELGNPDISTSGEFMYFLADREGFLASQQMKIGKYYAESYLNPAYQPQYYFRQKASLDKNLFAFLSDPIQPVKIILPCGEDTELYYMPYLLRTDLLSEENTNYLDVMEVSFLLRPIYEADQNQNFKSEYRAGEEITISLSDQILANTMFADDVAYCLQCKSVFAEDQNGETILFSDNGDGTFTGRTVSAGTYTLKAVWQGKESHLGVDTEAERVIMNTITVQNQHCTDLYSVELASFDVTGVLFGDVNKDGKVDGIDAGLLLQFLADWDVEIDRNAADVNVDGEIDGRDAGLLLQYLAEWDVSLGA